ncbi:MAG: hypothetical protein KBG30_11270 [Bacteroidales bacterium]|nr:hypothetical protein [Bacteroidales bacterium]
MNNKMNKQSFQNQNPKKENALDKIKKGEVKMRPRIYFIFRILLWVLGIILIFIAGVYLVDLIFIVLHKSGLWFTLGFGPKGIMIFLGNFPWVLLLITLIFVALLETLIRRFSITYKRPLIYSVLAILILISLVGFFIQKSSFNEHILKRAEEGRLPITHHFYNRYGMQKPENVFLGTVVEISNDKNFIIKKEDGTLIKVEILPNTHFPPRFEIKVGDYVIIMGEIKDGVIRADDIRNAPYPDNSNEGNFGPLPPILPNNKH